MGSLFTGTKSARATEEDSVQSFIKLGLTVTGFLFVVGCYHVETTALNVALLATASSVLGSFLSLAGYVETVRMHP